MYEWYQDNNITDIGYEDEEQMYDLRKSDLVGNVLKNMPVLILAHDYSWYITDFIVTANPNNKADEFLDYYRSNINDL